MFPAFPDVSYSHFPARYAIRHSGHLAGIMAYSDKPYIGRFAPSPSGPLHMGSLVCALASFLDARSNAGLWHVRVEDIDPPREVVGAGQQILESLTAHGLHWDGDIVYQSDRTEAYQNSLTQLMQQGKAYRCACTRKRLAVLTHNYDNACRELKLDDKVVAAIRLNTETTRQSLSLTHNKVCFEDGIQGYTCEDFQHTGDFVIHRKDGLYAYQLAVVVDDIAQGITHIVRGSDLLDTSAKQILLMLTLGYTPPSYCHIPVLAYSNGLKLSKQNHAPAIDNNNASHNLLRCLRYLNQSPPSSLNGAAHTYIIEWAIEHWKISQIPQRLSITQ